MLLDHWLPKWGSRSPLELIKSVCMKNKCLIYKYTQYIFIYLVKSTNRRIQPWCWLVGKLRDSVLANRFQNIGECFAGVRDDQNQATVPLFESSLLIVQKSPTQGIRLGFKNISGQYVVNAGTSANKKTEKVLRVTHHYLITQSKWAFCDMLCPHKHHRTITTQESTSPDKHRPGAYLQSLYVFTLF